MDLAKVSTASGVGKYVLEGVAGRKQHSGIKTIPRSTGAKRSTSKGIFGCHGMRDDNNMPLNCIADRNIGECNLTLSPGAIRIVYISNPAWTLDEISASDRDSGGGAQRDGG